MQRVLTNPKEIKEHFGPNTGKLRSDATCDERHVYYTKSQNAEHEEMQINVQQIDKTW